MPSLRIAIRYLLAKKSHTAVNVISYISIAGIAVAAMAMVCVLSVFNGFTDLATERLSLVDPDIKVTSTVDKTITNADSIAAEIARIPGVVAALPTLRSEAMATYGDTQLAINIFGVPVGYSLISSIDSLLIDGNMNADTYHRQGAVLSVGSANMLGAHPDPERPIVLTVPRRLGRINPALPMAAFTSDTMIVCGVYQTNQTNFDNSMIIIPLDNARRLLDYTTEATAVEIGVENPELVSSIKSEIEDLLSADFLVADRLRQQSHSFRMISIEKWITFLMLVFVLVMASFNILSSMSIMIIEKEESLKILSSFGAPLSMIRRIFLYQGVLIAAAGGLLGILAGIVLCLLQQQYGLITLSGDHSQMSIINYPCALKLIDVLLVAACVLLIGFVSGLISSRSVKMSSLTERPS